MTLEQLRRLADKRFTTGAIGFNTDGDIDWDSCDDEFIIALWNHADAMLDALGIAQTVNDDLRKAGFTMMNAKLYHALAKLETIK